MCAGRTTTPTPSEMRPSVFATAVRASYARRVRSSHSDFQLAYTQTHSASRTLTLAYFNSLPSVCVCVLCCVLDMRTRFTCAQTNLVAVCAQAAHECVLHAHNTYYPPVLPPFAQACEIINYPCGVCVCACAGGVVYTITWLGNCRSRCRVRTGLRPVSVCVL